MAVSTDLETVDLSELYTVVEKVYSLVFLTVDGTECEKVAEMVIAMVAY